MNDSPHSSAFLQTDANLRHAAYTQAQAETSTSTSYRGDGGPSEPARLYGVHDDQHVSARPQRRTVPSQRRHVRHKKRESAKTHNQKAEGKRQMNTALSPIITRPTMSMLTALDAQRLDPFNVYPQSKLPQYLHALIHHTFTHIVNPWLASDRLQEAERARAQVIGECVADPLVWYSMMMAGITHYAYVHEQALPDRSLSDNYAGKIHRMLRLSYKTQSIAQIRAALERDNGVPSDAALLAMSLLMAHGSSHNDGLVFRKQGDPNQLRKAFGTATNMQYYSSIVFEAQHWESIVRFVNKVRGGIKGIHWPLMQQSLQLVDTMISWRNLKRPSLDLLTPTSGIVRIAAHRPDEIADIQMRSLLSGLPLAWRTSPEHPHADLYLCLQHIRALIIRYNQYERLQTATQPTLRPDLRLIIYTRGLILHDLLELPVLTTSGKGAEGTYELTRHSALAFMQIVLFPVASVNELPRKILEQMQPLLVLCCKVQADQSIHKPCHTDAINAVDVSGRLVLWAWMLAGMLALEHLQTQQSSAWMDMLAPMVENFTIRPEKESWAIVKRVLEMFLWLESECDSGGQRWWNYACLWVNARRRDSAQKVLVERTRQREAK